MSQCLDMLHNKNTACQHIRPCVSADCAHSNSKLSAHGCLPEVIYPTIIVALKLLTTATKLVHSEFCQTLVATPKMRQERGPEDNASNTRQLTGPLWTCVHV